MIERFLVEDTPDGLPIMDKRGVWTKEKYAYLTLYDKMFATGMKNKWDTRVYIDLFAGSGFTQLEGSERVYHGSPLIALGVEDRFDKYVFCEANPKYLEALEIRVRRLFPEADADFVLGDCNVRVDDILSFIPRPSRDSSMLSLCFIDPYDIGIKFSTVRRLSKLRIDFLVLLMVGTDANRNEQHYTKPENRKVDDWLGYPDWREEWQAVKLTGKRFGDFLAEQYSARMATLDFIRQPLQDMKPVRNSKNSMMYRLALYSKAPKAYDLWEQTRIYGDDQLSLSMDF